MACNPHRNRELMRITLILEILEILLASHPWNVINLANLVISGKYSDLARSPLD